MINDCIMILLLLKKSFCIKVHQLQIVIVSHNGTLSHIIHIIANEVLRES